MSSFFSGGFSGSFGDQFNGMRGESSPSTNTTFTRQTSEDSLDNLELDRRSGQVSNHTHTHNNINNNNNSNAIIIGNNFEEDFYQYNNNLSSTPHQPMTISTSNLQRQLPTGNPQIYGMTPPSISNLEFLSMQRSPPSTSSGQVYVQEGMQFEQPQFYQQFGHQSDFHIPRPNHQPQTLSFQQQNNNFTNNKPLPFSVVNKAAATFVPPSRPTTPHQHLQSSLSSSRSTTPNDSQILQVSRPTTPVMGRPALVDWTLKLFKLDDFVFLNTVGTGTFGRVRLARLRDHEKFFAMKIMKKSEIIRLQQVDHIFSEKFLLSRLNCPFIIRLYGTFQDSLNLFMLLEYAIGGELFSYLRKAVRFPVGTTRFYSAEIVLALEYLHSINVVYRDLKPENLLLDSRGHVKIADFGFAKVIPDNRTWTLCGTPEYLAPEIILGRGHGRPVDWWALGILIYEMLAGFPPFYDDTPFLIYEKILAGKLEFPNHFDPIVCDLLTKLLQPDPQRRLGCGAGGAQDVKNHPWFRGVNWEMLWNRKIEAPFVPNVRHSGDTGNFEEYPEEDLIDDRGQKYGEDPNRHVFTEF